MKIKFILIIVILSSFLFAATSFSQELTEREMRIFNYSFDESMESNDDINRINRRVANEYGITINELESIIKRGYDHKLSDWEWEVSGVLGKKLGTLPKHATQGDYNRVYSEVANNYGISVNRLYYIYILSWDEMFWF